MVLVELVVAGGVVYMVKRHRKKNRERANKDQYEEYVPLSGGGTANVASNSQPYIPSQGGVGSYGINGGTANKI